MASKISGIISTRIERSEEPELESPAPLFNNNASLSTFHKFQALASEIRNMIWDAAIQTPQVLVFHRPAEQVSDKTQNNRRDAVMQACHESRERVMNSKLPYYKLNRELRGWIETEPMKHFFNPSVDTIWIENSAFLPDNLEFYCGTCENQTIFPQRSQFMSICRHDIKLRRVVVALSHWQDPSEPHDREYDPGTASTLWMHNSIPELYIIVGEQTVVPQDEFEFVIPKMLPEQDQSDSRAQPHIDTVSVPELWYLSARQLEDKFENFKAESIEIRKIQRESGWDTEELHARGMLPDLSRWETPKVRYVEVKCKSRD